MSESSAEGYGRVEDRPEAHTCLHCPVLVPRGSGFPFCSEACADAYEAWAGA